jgi:hypothetical protein
MTPDSFAEGKSVDIWASWDDCSIALVTWMFQNKERSCLLVGERNREESRGVFGLRRNADSFRKQMGLAKVVSKCNWLSKSFRLYITTIFLLRVETSERQTVKKTKWAEAKKIPSPSPLANEDNSGSSNQFVATKCFKNTSNEFCYKFELDWRLFGWAV